MSTAVIGATGRVGSEIVRGLLARGDAVTALVRDPGKARRAFGEPGGLHIRVTRLDDPRDLTGALNGIRTVFIAMGSVGIEANRPAFGEPSDAKGQPAGFPQARVVTLTETGTHASIDARVGGFRGAEPELAIAMAGRAAGMLVIMDRGFPGWRCGWRIRRPARIC